jgi:hypothetical protein
MKCQHVGDTGQCLQDATRDIRIRTSKSSWRFFVCDDCEEEEIEILRSYIDRVAREQITQDTNSPIEKG